MFMPIFSTPDTRKAVVEDATVEEALDHLSDIGPEKTIFLCKTLVIDLFQRFKIRSFTVFRG